MWCFYASLMILIHSQGSELHPINLGGKTLGQSVSLQVLNCLLVLKGQFCAVRCLST